MWNKICKKYYDYNTDTCDGNAREDIEEILK